MLVINSFLCFFYASKFFIYCKVCIRIIFELRAELEILKITLLARIRLYVHMSLVSLDGGFLGWG